MAILLRIARGPFLFGPCKANGPELVYRMETDPGFKILGYIIRRTGF